MSTIALRTYISEIEESIDNGQIEEAIANCQHILTTFPKHIDTYRQIGKAYLEDNQYSAALDIFQRILSSVPNDFVSHIGMSIIHEDEGNINEAIWHMERAFEVQPANVAIQEELRRLFGVRDGVEPLKIRLTRGALARMYIKGNLYQQAIAEIRAALNADDSRLDLLALLAESYKHNGQDVEAANIAQQLLTKLPYSLAANRIMAKILFNEERNNEAEPYFQRLIQLDPYYQYADKKLLNTDTVSDNAVTIEKLEWIPPLKAVEESDEDFFNEIDNSDIPDALEGIIETEKEDIEDETQAWGELASMEASAAILEELLEDEPQLENITITPDEGIEDKVSDELLDIPISEEESETEEIALPENDLPDWLQEFVSETNVDNNEEISTETKTLDDEFEWEDTSLTGSSEPNKLVTNETQERITKETDISKQFLNWEPESQDEQLNFDDTKPLKIEIKEEKFENDKPTEEKIKSENEESSSSIAATLGGIALGTFVANATESEDTPTSIPEDNNEFEQIISEGEFVQEVKHLEDDEFDKLFDEIEGEDILTGIALNSDAKTDSSKIHNETPRSEETETSVHQEDLSDDSVSDAPIEKDETTLITNATATIANVPTSHEAEIIHENANNNIDERLSEDLFDETATQEENYPEQNLSIKEDSTTQENGSSSMDELDEDAAYAWLESLAAKQGANEDELLLNPEDRVEETPDWIIELSKETQEDDTNEHASDIILTPTEEVTSDQENITTKSSEANVPDWLQELNSNEELVDKQIPSIENGEPEEELTSISEVVSNVSEEDIDKLFQSATGDGLELPPTISTDIHIPDDGNNIEDAPDLPDWLQDDTTVEKEESSEWSPPPTIKEDTTFEKVDINTGSLKELESIPGIGFIIAQKIINYRKDNGPFKTLEEIQNIKGLDFQSIKGYITIQTKTYQMEAETLSADSTEKTNNKIIFPEIDSNEFPDLVLAHKAINQNNLDEAIQNYSNLIKSEQALSIVIQDLEELTSLFPKEVSFWQTLGDAYFRDNQITKAMAVYATAEELLK